MSYTLFLDDERKLPSWLETWRVGTEVRICKDIDELKWTIIEYGVPDTISFDHDLGMSADGEIKPNSLQALKWLIEEHLDLEIDLSTIQKVFVHSSNPAGVDNLCSLWDNFAVDVLRNDVRAERKEAT